MITPQIKNLMNKDSRFPSNFIKDQKNQIIFYIHQKAGCTVFLKMIFQNLGILEEALAYDKNGGAWPHYYRYEVYQKENKVEPIDLFSGDYKLIKIVRNPYYRAVSSFISAHFNVVQSAEYNKGEDITKIKRFNLRDYIIARHLGNSTNSFYNYYKSIKDENGLEVDLHIDKQKCLFEDYIKFDEIIKLEELENKIDYLNDKYNLNFQFIRKSSHHTTINKELCQFVGYDHWDSIPRCKMNVPPYNFFYNDDKIKNLIYELYQDEIQIYDYNLD